MRRAQLHTEQEKIFTGVVDTWRVGTNQQYLYSIGEYLIFAWLFQRKKVACRGILTAQDSSPLDSARVSWRLESARLRSSLLAARVRSSPLDSLGGSSRLEPSRVQVLLGSSPRVQGCLEPSPLESRSGLGSSRLVNNTRAEPTFFLMILYSWIHSYTVFPIVQSVQL